MLIRDDHNGEDVCVLGCCCCCSRRVICLMAAGRWESFNTVILAQAWHAKNLCWEIHLSGLAAHSAFKNAAPMSLLQGSQGLCSAQAKHSNAESHGARGRCLTVETKDMCLTEISWTNITSPLPGSTKVNICWMLLLKSDWLPRETREMIFTCAYRAYSDKLALQVKVLGRSIRCYSIISLYSRQHLVRKQPHSNKYFHLLQKFQLHTPTLYLPHFGFLPDPCSRWFSFFHF